MIDPNDRPDRRSRDAEGSGDLPATQPVHEERENDPVPFLERDDGLAALAPRLPSCQIRVTSTSSEGQTAAVDPDPRRR
jgi:hypothetical protein